MNKTCVFCALGLGLLGCVSGWSQEPVKGDVWSNLDVQFYGYIKADAAWNDSQVVNGNYLKWAESESGGSTASSEAGRNDDEFAITARETRFGFKVTGPELEGWKSRGQIEVDFFGGTAENKSNPMMRHAFLSLTNPEKGLTVLAGQTWDVVAPLNPRTLSYSVLWWIGNIGYRRPQIRVEKKVDMGEGASLLTQVALARTLGTSGGTFASEPGADSGLPQVQGRLALTLPGIGPKPATVGVSGHYGKEEHDYNGGGDNVKVDTWSGNLDVLLPVCSACTLKAELHTGSNLSAYLGGIGQGVMSAGTSTARAVRSSGGWIAAAVTASPDTTMNLGYGMEKVCERDVASSTGRTSNRCLFGNVIRSVNKVVDLGLEVTYFKTTYKDNADGEGMRVQGSLILKI